MILKDDLFRPNISSIEVCGGIASGKTTLVRLLTRADISPILENFQSNPFWKDFYADPINTAFETEISFLLQHYHDIKTAAQQKTDFACDFSLLLDLAYAHVTLDKRKLSAFTAVYREIRRELPKACLVVHLNCDPETELERIRRRGRKAELSITVDYLAAINQSLSEVIRNEATSRKVLTVDSAVLDFAINETDRQTVLKCVNSRLAQTVDH